MPSESASPCLTRCLLLWLHSPKISHIMKHPTEPQRYKISAFIEAGLNKTQIAQKLNVHKSTITREIQRNGYGRYRNYKPRIAQERAQYRWLHRKLPCRFKESVKETARELLEKGTDFDEVTDAFLEEVEQALNNRPRKRYGFLTPLERFSEVTGLPASNIF